ncbi:low molecular weight phosphotyrosine protein phosphatase [Georgenia satyanarayanai]|uniref:low molecular weight protein-tyrosine-phosphatase n=1 Tax=Georgenia satyanarayanai TaxID=860221 RepID=UPI00203DE0B6|nr:low molecular weight protein-tyrosine-phosphatase [Georgenia satyanarayanai]MCM3660487.1 low molecular weight phosphotyrosine protein phosphatase [Georgenia satyanarayanai]
MSPFTVSFVCTGNICRSPMGEVVLRDLLEREGLADRVRVVSAGTGDWHVGGPADPRAVSTLKQYGLDGEQHRAQQFAREGFAEVDLVLALDRGHERALRTLAPTPQDADKVRLLRSFDEDAVAAGELEVDDPYFGEDADFVATYEEVLPACEGVVAHLRERLSLTR